MTSLSLPVDSLRRVINNSASGGRNISQPSSDQVSFLDEVCPLAQTKSLFSFPLVFSPSE